LNDSLQNLESAITAKAHAMGLKIGFASANAPLRIEQYRKWVEEGKAGTMTYLNRSVERRANPELVLPSVKSVISIAQSYFTGGVPTEVKHDPSRGLIASYAWGKDYHDTLLAKLEELAGFIRSVVRDREVAGIIETKCYVDTGHILERDFGEAASLGFIGKNTMLIQPDTGSFFFLGEILTTLELEPTPREPMPNCGSCTRCLNVCPTYALPAEYILDSNLCISYLTIEYKGVIARELRSKMGNHIFGCDDCQDCCPWNRFAGKNHPPYPPASRGEDSRRVESPDSTATANLEIRRCEPFDTKVPKLTDLAMMTEVEFQSRFAGSAVLRAKYEGFMRNVAIALGNWGSEEAIASLEHLSSQESPLIRLHAVWSLGQIKHERSRRLLREMLEDRDDAVRREAADMLNENTP
jgi:epoxyqueuosine reductase